MSWAKQRATHLGMSVVLAVASLVGYSAVDLSPTQGAEGACAQGTFQQRQKDVFHTAATGYRVHGILRDVYCYSPILTENHQYYYYQDVRYCDGCSSHSVSTIRLTARAWKCGNSIHNTTITKSNFWWVDSLSPWAGYAACGAQADASGYSSKSGVYSFSWYLNY